MQARLIVTGGKTNKREVSLTVPIVVGRSREAGLTVAHPMVSRQHCEIFESRGLLRIRDLRSTNGTYVAGKRIEEAVLRPHEQFTIGPLTFEVDYECVGDVTLDHEEPATATSAEAFVASELAADEMTPAPSETTPSEHADAAFGFLADRPSTPELEAFAESQPESMASAAAPGEVPASEAFAVWPEGAGGLPEVEGGIFSIETPAESDTGTPSVPEPIASVDAGPAPTEPEAAAENLEAAAEIAFPLPEVAPADGNLPDFSAWSEAQADTAFAVPPQSAVDAEPQSAPWENPPEVSPSPAMAPHPPPVPAKARRGWWPFKRNKAAGTSPQASVQGVSTPEYRGAESGAPEAPQSFRGGGATNYSSAEPSAGISASNAARGDSQSDLNDFLNGLR